MSAAAASPLLLALQLLLGVGPAVPAKLSVYWPGDGHNKGQLACGGVFSREQVHVAVRDWPQRGCRRRVVVFSAETGRAVLARVMDAGPFGIVRVTGSAGARERGKDWGIWTKSLRAPPGWRFRGMWTSRGACGKLSAGPSSSLVCTCSTCRESAGPCGSAEKAEETWIYHPEQGILGAVLALPVASCSRRTRA